MVPCAKTGQRPEVPCSGHAARGVQEGSGRARLSHSGPSLHKGFSPQHPSEVDTISESEGEESKAQSTRPRAH